jgi:hypothetical protein
MGGVPGGMGGRSGFGVGAFGELGSRGGISGLGGCGTGSSGTGGFGVGSGMVRLSDMYVCLSLRGKDACLSSQTYPQFHPHRIGVTSYALGNCTAAFSPSTAQSHLLRDHPRFSRYYP